MKKEDLNRIRTMENTAALCLSLTGSIEEEWFCNLFLTNEASNGINVKPRFRASFVNLDYIDFTSITKLYKENNDGKELVEYAQYWVKDWHKYLEKGMGVIFPLIAFWDEEELRKLINVPYSLQGKEEEGEKAVKKNLNRLYRYGEKVVGWRYVGEDAFCPDHFNTSNVNDDCNNYNRVFAYFDIRKDGKLVIGVGRTRNPIPKSYFDSPNIQEAQEGPGEPHESLVNIAEDYIYIKGDLSEENPVAFLGSSFLLPNYEPGKIESSFYDLVVGPKEVEEAELIAMTLGLSHIIYSTINTLTKTVLPDAWGKALIFLSKANLLLSQILI